MWTTSVRIPPRLVRALALVAITAMIAGVGYVVLGGIVRHQLLTLPAPAGRFPVGRATYQYTDDTRVDPLAPTPGQPRRLAAWVWYPAATATGEPARYLPGAWTAARSGPFWGGFVQDPERIVDRAHTDAPVERGPLRTLVMEPGLGLAAVDYAAVAEDLASRGYAVIGVTPTYSANTTVLDGSPVTATDAGKNPNDALAQVWADDARFAADRVVREPRFVGTLDRHTVAYFGHSFGGASAVQACQQDPGCVAAADVDGQPFGTVVHLGPSRPYLMIGNSDLCPKTGCADMPGLHELVSHARGPVRAYAVHDAQHFNFTDLALYHIMPPSRLLFPLGDIDPAKGLRIEADLLDAFFTSNFGGPSTMDSVAAACPELRAVTSF